MEVEVKIRGIMAELFHLSPEDIDDEATPETIEGWDSMSHLNLVLALEEEYGIRFDDNEILEIVSFQLICEAVRRHVGS
jgi:acyl carrier protein